MMKMIKYCPKCGKEVRGGVRFCTNCGMVLGGGVPAAKKSKKTGKRVAIILLVILILGAAGVVACFFLGPGRTREPVQSSALPAFTGTPPSEIPLLVDSAAPTEVPDSTTLGPMAPEETMASEEPTDSPEPTVAPARSASAKSDNYILPDARVRLYSMKYLRRLSKKKLRLARNEIYARHGYIFKDKKLRYYFMDKVWYYPTRRNVKDSDLNYYERKNIQRIQKCEKQK